ncbi:hypothetical protein Bca4012_043302 [Brassica carinata]
MWVTNYDRLSTRARLVLWGLPIPVSCPLCNTAPETRDHLFLSCQYNNDVWSQDFTRCGPPHQSSASVFRAIDREMKNLNSAKRSNKLFTALMVIWLH